MKIAIHQPNFFPYYPFFQKMREVDIFVLMIHCQFEKNNYQNRFEYDGWNTMSVNGGLELIKDKKYVNYIEDWKRITGKINKLQIFDSCISESLSIMNILIIKEIAKILKINTKIEIDYPTELKGTDRLVDICKHFGANEYLSGISGKNYLELNKFDGIKVKFQNKLEMINKPIIFSI